LFLAGASFLFLLVLRPTPAYAALAMPFLLWPALEGYALGGKYWRWIPAMYALLSLAGYVYLVRTNWREGFGSREFQAVQAQLREIARAEHRSLPSLKVTGDDSLWFAHPEHYAAMPDSAPLQDADVYLCFDGPLQSKGLSPTNQLWCGQMRTMAPMHEVQKMVLKGHTVHAYVPGQ
jgi:hypothetical protein